jgi:suppressor for copper-sensitivity B
MIREGENNVILAKMSFFRAIKKTVLAAAAFSCFCVAPLFSADVLAETAASDWAKTEQTRVRLISALEKSGERETLLLGLHFQMEDGWKVYWRAPGDAGYPPELDWKGSENLGDAVMSWPAPLRFSVLGTETLGYKKEVVFPITATLTNPGEALALRVSVDYLTCNEVCIPVVAELSLDISEGPGEPSPFSHLISRFSDQVPKDGAAHGLVIKTAEAASTGEDSAVLLLAAQAKPSFSKPDLYVEGPDDLWFSAPEITFEDGGKTALLKIRVEGVKDLVAPLAGTPMTFTLVDGMRAAEKRLVIAAAPGGADFSDESSFDFAVILLLAVLGGLILNLMPCVLPVLSIKLLGVISHGGGDKKTVRLSFIASSLGILFSFMLLAAFLIALKAMGGQIGWGIQFQNPFFLVAMILVISLFAYNLWGFFEFRLPYWMWDFGEHSSHVHGLGGNFMSGAFATLLATPCSAPFLGTAVGFALARGPMEILSIFFALGIGLALPYIAVAVSPSLATALPKPGPWIARLRFILGFALLGTALWLLSVLFLQISTLGAIGVSVIVVALGTILFFKTHNPKRFGVRARLFIPALILGAFIVPVVLGGRPAGLDGLADKDPLWRPFDEAALSSLVKGGQVVLVDVSADWCITCKINKAFVLTSGKVFERLSNDVVPMQADWTLPSDTISRYLAKFDRYAIPFNAVYGPNAPGGIVLPELLSEEDVIKAFERAAAKPRKAN